MSISLDVFKRKRLNIDRRNDKKRMKDRLKMLAVIYLCYLEQMILSPFGLRMILKAIEDVTYARTSDYANKIFEDDLKFLSDIGLVSIEKKPSFSRILLDTKKLSKICELIKNSKAHTNLISTLKRIGVLEKVSRLR